MNYDKDKVDEFTLALLYLVVHTRHEGLGASAWNGFDWETMDRLHKKDYITNPVGKAKSVGLTEEGYLKAKKLFEKHFVKESKVVPLPKFTSPAKKRWTQLPEPLREKLLKNVWCSQCRTMVTLQLREGQMTGRSLVLRGTCKTCGSEVARIIEPDEG
ncbi:MAG: DUF6429 family protein [Smithella sp.]